MLLAGCSGFGRTPSCYVAHPQAGHLSAAVALTCRQCSYSMGVNSAPHGRPGCCGCKTPSLPRGKGVLVVGCGINMAVSAFAWALGAVNASAPGGPVAPYEWRFRTSTLRGCSRRRHSTARAEFRTLHNTGLKPVTPVAHETGNRRISYHAPPETLFKSIHVHVCDVCYLAVCSGQS